VPAVPRSSRAVTPVSPLILRRLRLICLDLPEVSEEQAWVGVRWVVAKANFAHVVMIEAGHPPAYAKAAGSDGPLCVLTFRGPRADLAAPRYSRLPFFRPPWFENIAGMAVDEKTDWDEVQRLLIRSYCELAPKRLRVRVEQG
jgi:hypothetical protein